MTTLAQKSLPPTRLTIPTANCYNPSMATPDQHGQSIRSARARSNRGIAQRNALMVAESLDKDFIAIIGDGTFVSSRETYIALFRQNFGNGAQALTYERIADTVDVSTAGPFACERGHWVATSPNGMVTHTGAYSAMWRRGPSGWKLRSELFVTLFESSE